MPSRSSSKTNALIKSLFGKGGPKKTSKGAHGGSSGGGGKKEGQSWPIKQDWLVYAY